MALKKITIDLSSEEPKCHLLYDKKNYVPISLKEAVTYAIRIEHYKELMREPTRNDT